MDCAKKQDNSGIKKWRIVINYRKLKENTVDDKFPIPNLNGILDKLGKSQYFTTLDLAKGFHQMLAKEEDRKKTGFSTPFEHYEFIRNLKRSQIENSDRQMRFSEQRDAVFRSSADQ